MLDLATADEIQQLTGCRQRKRQYDWLVNAGITVKVNAAGDLLVHRSVLEKWLGVGPKRNYQKARVEPNFTSI